MHKASGSARREAHTKIITGIQSEVKFCKPTFSLVLSFEALLTNVVSLYCSWNSSPPTAEDRKGIVQDKDGDKEIEKDKRMHFLSMNAGKPFEGHILRVSYVLYVLWHCRDFTEFDQKGACCTE